MKKLFLVISSVLLMNHIFAESTNLKRIGNDPKTLGYAVLKEPAKLVEKINKNADKIMPGLSQMINGNPMVAMTQPLLEKTEFILAVAISKDTIDEQPTVIGVLKVSDKTALEENIFLAGIEPKLIVDQFLIVGGTPEELKNFSDKHLNNYKNLKGHDDIGVFLDIKAFVNASEKDIGENIPSFKALLQQLDYFNVSLTIEDAGIGMSTKLTPTQGSNLETAFDYKSVPMEKLLGYFENGNFLNTITKTVDGKKSKPLIADIVNAVLGHKDVTEETKPAIKEFHKKLNEVLDIIGEVSSASSADIGKELTQSQIYKTDKPEAILNYMKNINTTITDVLGKIDNPLVKDIAKQIDIKIKEDGETNGVKIYSMETLSEKGKEENAKVGLNFTPSVYYFSIVPKFFIMSTNKSELSKIITQIKANKPPKDVTLFAQKHYGTGKTMYSDLDLRGYAKMLKLVFDAQGIGDMVPLDGIINADIKPIAMQLTFNKNAGFGFFLDFSTISTLVSEGQNLFMGFQAQAAGNLQDDDEDLMQQP